jgi:hypothetical protein
VLASSLRLITVAVLAGLVIREIWRPELDVVRQAYADDPDGGVLDAAPDAPWVTGLRRSLRLDKSPAIEPPAGTPDDVEKSPV